VNVKRDITTQNTLAALYEAFDKLNEYYFNNELPTVCIIISDMTRKHTYGWLTVNKIWKDDRDGHTMHEIALSASLARRGSHFVVGVLLHEMIHLYCSVKGIKDTSNGVTYHNSRFKEECEHRGLIFKQDKVCKVNGWYQAELSEEAETVVDGFNLDLNAFAISRTYVEEIDDIEVEVEEETVKTARKTKRNSEYSCSQCDLRFKTKGKLKIMCGDCEILLDEENFEFDFSDGY